VIRSMTGFGASTLDEGGLVARVEVRSVNHRHLQVKSRLPQDLVQLEPEVEARVKLHAERGSVTVTVGIERAGGRAPARIDREVARRYQREIEAVAKALSLDARVSIETLLDMPGVIASSDGDEQRDLEARLALKCLERALKELVAMREREGKSLLADLKKNAAGVRKVLKKLEKRMPRAVAEHHESLRRRVEELLGEGRVAGGRAVTLQGSDLAREVALLADKMDVSEEFTRLESHLSQLDVLLASKKAVGRQLDFLVQEFLREANTIGSKCNDAEAAHAVVELKTLIERLREQVQNVE